MLAPAGWRARASLIIAPVWLSGKKFIMRTLCIMLLLLLCAQGCGRRGPLYLPPPDAVTGSAHLPFAQEDTPS
ncbi:MAG: hypothetical protein COS20_03490 [Gallionellaceae bacterium CG02_land_8_20_14_3_00_60_115]|nr:MAG: hypothetical protein COS20_03490 [Gallionellaceae bacterium CG02_land_8_20_14_3_00_60_115]PIY06704.1 MAG: hypothetical protein COZ19_00655 [Gallionellaceae bacterium CG_4_10_14_3_um_filter_60_1069]